MTPARAVRFYLVRHGRAEAKHAAGDAARRLTAEGRAAFFAHAAAAAGELALSRVATSPLARARETAELLGQATGAPVREEPALASGASTGAELLRLGERLGAGAALVGHNPELAEAVALVAGRHLEVPPGAIAAVEADGAGFRLAWLRAP
jgi:phosphohistidine phosphatase